MVGIVVVSHSQRLAEAAVELALQMVRGAPPPIGLAAGLDNHVLGTDAARVKEAIDRVGSPDGVLVLMDLGSAVLSAELALELRGGDSDCPVVLSDGPLVEGLVAAVTMSAAGASLDEVAAEASQAGTIKSTLLGVAPDRPAASFSPGPLTATIELAVHNEHGLHARPAARLVETVRRFDAEVTVRNVTEESQPVDGRSVSALSTLGVLAGHQIEVGASGRQAREALAAISALVRRNFDEAVTPSHVSSLGAPNGPIGASSGIGIGPKTGFGSMDHVAATSVGAAALSGGGSARQRLQAALETARSDLISARDRVGKTAGPAAGEIFDAYVLLLDDDGLSGRAFELIDTSGYGVETAWRTAFSQLADRFQALPDPYQQARAQDIHDVGQRVLDLLEGTTHGSAGSPSGVVVVTDLTPAQAADLDPTIVSAVVAAHGTPVSHGVILARSLGIPMVIGAGEDVLTVPDGTTLLVDGTTGVVIVDPDPDETAKYEQVAVEQNVRAEHLLRQASRPALTTDGQHIEVVANVAGPTDAAEAVQRGADGVGLLRTEFLFLDRPEPPGEDEQLEAYLAIAHALGRRRLTIRTLDVGGDKTLPYLGAPAEENPFLGRRGLRLSLHHQDMFEQQLRAIIRAGIEHPVTVLFPMVTTIDELRTARALLAKAASEVGCPPGQLPPGFQVGAMAEVPAFALRARAAASLVDVISIGSNDLTQYTLAAERGNVDVASLADPVDPSVLALIASICRGAAGSARVAVCGEVASDAQAAVLLIGLGVRELSVTPRAIPEIKERIRRASASDAKQLAELALQRDSAASVRALLSDLG